MNKNNCRYPVTTIELVAFHFHVTFETLELWRFIAGGNYSVIIENTYQMRKQKP